MLPRALPFALHSHANDTRLGSEQRCPVNICHKYLSPTDYPTRISSPHLASRHSPCATSYPLVPPRPLLQMPSHAEAMANPLHSPSTSATCQSRKRTSSCSVQQKTFPPPRYPDECLKIQRVSEQLAIADHTAGGTFSRIPACMARRFVCKFGVMGVVRGAEDS